MKGFFVDIDGNGNRVDVGTPGVAGEDDEVRVIVRVPQGVVELTEETWCRLDAEVNSMIERAKR